MMAPMSRLLTHPQARDLTVAGILHALSDPTRLAIVCELLKARAGMNCTETARKLKRPMAKSTCSQHYRILREAGVIASERVGVDLTSRVRTAELETRFPGLLTSIIESYRKDTRRAHRA
jgi:DNA-binding transcriptional ArsR family regulator